MAFLAGCIANVSFARLNEATVRVLQKNGCEVVIPEGQSCCGALHLHSGLREEARKLARRNIDAILAASFDAVITNAAGCGSTLKEYDELLRRRPGLRREGAALLGPDAGRHRVPGLYRTEPAAWDRWMPRSRTRIPATWRTASASASPPRSCCARCPA